MNDIKLYEYTVYKVENSIESILDTIQGMKAMNELFDNDKVHHKLMLNEIRSIVNKSYNLLICLHAIQNINKGKGTSK